MWCPLETVEAQHLFLSSIHLAEHMDADPLVTLQMAELNAKPKGTGGNIDRLGRVYIVTQLLPVCTPS